MARSSISSQSETAESSHRSGVLLFWLFILAGIVFATSVMVQLGTLAGLAACLLVGLAAAGMLPERVVR